MSGPKIVDIRAQRRQWQRDSAALLRELSGALDECLRLQQMTGADATDLRERGRGLLGKLGDMREAEQYPGLLSEAATYRDFYASEAQKLRRAVVEQRTAALRQEHRRRHLTTQLREEIARMPRSEESARLLRGLEAAGGDEAALTQLLAEGSALRQAQADSVASNRLRTLAQEYMEPEQPGAPRFIENTNVDPDHARLERCWSLLAEMEITSGEGSIRAWKEQAATVVQAAPEERSMLLDSLALEMSEHFRAARERQALVAAAEGLLADLGPISAPEAEAHRTSLRATLEAAGPIVELKESVEKARDWLTGQRAGEDAEAQRLAILAALGALGYEVREGMASAWVEHGRIVMRKPNEPTYGVEFATPATGSALQTRVVTSAPNSSNPQRDKEVEEVWCTEFSKLRELLQHDGYQLELKQAFAPGTVPMKVSSDAVSEERRVASPLIARSTTT